MNAHENSKNRAGTIYKEIETEIDLYKKFPYRTIQKVMPNEIPVIIRLILIFS